MELNKDFGEFPEKIRIAHAVYVRNAHVITNWFGTTAIQPARVLYVDVSMNRRTVLGTFVLN